MANELKIVLKVTDQGTNNLLSFADALKKIQTTINANLVPLRGLSEGVASIGGSVKNLEAVAQKSIKAIADQTKRTLDDTNNKINENIEKTTETLYSRSALAISASFVFLNERFINFLGVATSGTKTISNLVAIAGAEAGSALGAFSAKFIVNVKGYIAGVNAVGASATAASMNFGLWSANILQSTGPLSFLSEILLSVNGTLGAVVGKITTITGFGASIVLGKALLSEYLLFFRRIAGFGASTVGPLERVTRLITFFDSGIARANFRVGELIKTVGFLGLTFTSGPFGGIVSFIPFVNSMVSNLISLGERFRLRVFSFLGSSQAQFSLIIFDLKEVALKVLPSLIRIAQALADVMKRVKKEQIDAIFEKLFGIEPKLRGISGVIATLFSPIKAIGGVISTIMGKATSIPRGIGNSFSQAQFGKDVTVFSGKKQLADELKAMQPVTDKAKLAFVEMEIVILRAFNRLEIAIHNFSANMSRDLLQGFSDLKAILSQMPALVDKFAVGFNKVSESVKESQVNLQKFLSTMKSAASETSAAVSAKLFSGTAPKFSGRGRPGAEGLSKSVIPVFGAFDALAEGKKKFSDLALLPKQLEELSLAMEKFGKRSGQNINLKPLLSGFNLDKEALRKAVSEPITILKSLIDSATKEFGIEEKKFSKALSKVLSFSSTEKGKNLPEEQAKLIKQIIATVNQTLTAALTSGGEISKQLAQGMQSGSAAIEKVTKDITEHKIADYFPQSPAKLGALVALPIMGAKIPALLAGGMTANSAVVIAASALIAGKIAFSIASGIRSGINLAVTATQELVSAVSGTISQISQVIAKPLQSFNIAERTGASIQTVTALSAVIEDFGGSAADAGTIVSKLTDSLARGFTPEDIQKFQTLGIDMEQIKKSGDPTLSLFLALSDAVKEAGAGSRQAATAFELMGVTANSSVVNVLQQGSEKLGEFLTEINKISGGVDETFGKNARQFTILTSAITRAKDAVITNFVGTILPAINGVLDKVVDFFTENSAYIRAFAIIAGQTVVNLVDLVSGFIKLLITEPRKAFEVITGTAQAIIKFISSAVGRLSDLLFGDTGAFLQGVGEFVLDSAIRLFIILADEAQTQLLSLLSLLIDKFGDFFAAIVDGSTKLLPKVGNVIITFGTRLPAIVGAILDDLFLYLPGKIFQGVFSAFEFVAKKLGALDNPIFKYLGLDFKLLEGQLAEAGKQADKTFIGKSKVGEVFSEAVKEVSALNKEVDITFSGVNEDVKNIQETIDQRTGETRKKFTEFFGEAKQRFSTLAEQAKKAGNEISDAKVFEGLKSDLEELVNGITGTLGGSDLKEKFNALLQGVSPENIKNVIAQVREEIDKVTTSFEKSGKAASDSANMAMGQWNRVFALKQKESAIIAEVNARVYNDRAAINQKEIIDLQEKHRQEELQFKSLQEQILAEMRQRGATEVEIEEFYAQQKAQIVEMQAAHKVETNKTLAEQSRRDLLDTMNVISIATSGASQFFGEVFEMMGKKSRELFFVQKAVAVAEAIMNVAKGVTAALGTGGGGIAQAAVVSAMGAVQIAKIIGTTIQGKADGGLITQGAGPRADDNLIRVSRGEYVLNARAVSAYGTGLIGAMNNLQIPKPVFAPQAPPSPVYSAPKSAFADGGLVGANTQSEQQKQPLNIAVSVDPQEVLVKALSTLEGERVLIGAIGKNKRAIQLQLNG